jgi:hypothetical protein
VSVAVSVAVSAAVSVAVSVEQPSVEQVTVEQPSAAANVVVSVVIDVSGPLLVEASVLPLLVAAAVMSLLARMIDVQTATEIGSETVTTTTAAAHAVRSIVSEPTETIVIAVTMNAMQVPMEMTEKVRQLLQLATMSSCPGTEADTRISSRLPTPCAR